MYCDSYRAHTGYLTVSSFGELDMPSLVKTDVNCLLRMSASCLLLLQVSPPFFNGETPKLSLFSGLHILPENFRVS